MNRGVRAAGSVNCPSGQCTKNRLTATFSQPRPVTRSVNIDAFEAVTRCSDRLRALTGCDHGTDEMSQYKGSLNNHLDYIAICADAGCGYARPDELMQLGPHLHDCADCRELLYEGIQMSAFELSEKHTEFVTGTAMNPDRSYEEFEAKYKRLRVRMFLYAWGETKYGPQRVTLLVLRTPEDGREHEIWYKDNPDAPIALDFLFARTERPHAPGTKARRKQALFRYWSNKRELMWEAVYDSWDLVQ
jgi:hypothetical protein